MELIYLWIEDYKNIQKQGFSFSPRFKCDFDQEKNELTIEENKEYNSTFPNNINITAIVGENGSGKSNLLKSILGLHDGNINYFYDDEYNRKFTPNIEGKIQYLFFDKANNQLYASENLILKNSHNNTISFISLKNNLISCISYFHTYIDTMNRNSKSMLKSIKVISEKNLKYDKVFRHIKPSNGHISHYLMESYYLKKSIMASRKIILPADFIFPNILEITPNAIAFRDGDKKYQAIQELFKERELNTINSNFFELVKLLAIYNIYNKLDEKIDIESLFKVINNNSFGSIDKKYKNYFKKVCCLEYRIKRLKPVDNNKTNFFKILENEKQLLKIIKLHDKIVLEGKGIEILKFEMNNSKLSDGQMQYLKLFSLIITSVMDLDNKNNILILDEIELFMHPNWKKQFINYLIRILKTNYPNKKFHIIFTTHSPFLLSDLPKENIIFLKKGKQVYLDIETFGANIHTLLSHGFFMDNGLMGEFAKEQINRAIILLNKSKLNEEDAKFCENIISITGEPILKRQMQKMLDSKKIDYIAKDTKEEIELLKHRIDILSKRL